MGYLIKEPQLRFPGFSEEWRLKKLKEEINLISGQHLSPDAYNHTKNGNPYFTGPSDYTNDLAEITKWTDNCNNFGLFGDVLITVKGSGVGALLFLKLPKVAIGRQLMAIRSTTTIGSFIFYCLETRTGFYQKLAMGNMIPGISRQDILQTKLHLPSLPEQQNIADFLSAVDKKIQLLTRKKELLEEYKKGVMQKIFSREIRFKDENGREFPEWEKKRLDEIVMEFIVPMRDKPKQLDGPIPWCRIEDFEGKYLYESKTQQGVTLETVKAMNLKVYPINTLLVSCSANLGFCAITKKELITNQTFIGLFPNQRMVNVQFLLYIMRLSSQRLNTLSSGTTISYLSRKQFEQFEITLPSLPEQDLISEFISKLDGKVDAIQSQISLTQQFKKGLLQQMFV